MSLNEQIAKILEEDANELAWWNEENRTRGTTVGAPTKVLNAVSAEIGRLRALAEHVRSLDAAPKPG